MNNADNMDVVTIQYLLQIDPALEAILKAPPGSTFRRTGNGYVADDQ